MLEEGYKMFDHYGNKYNCEFRIYGANDDNKTYHKTYVDIYSTYPISKFENLDSMDPYNRWTYETGTERRDTHQRGNKIIVSCRLSRRVYTKGEPLVVEIKETLQSVLGWGTRRWGTSHKPPETFKVAFVLPNSGMAVMVEKGKTYYQLMSHRVRKKNLLLALSRFIYRSCFEDDPKALLTFIIKMITMPENVSYVLENRTPFFFFNVKERQKVNCRLRTIMINNTECALEISDGVWAPISINDLDIMVNYFYHEHTRAKKWANMSPKKLWTVLMGEPPSESQLQLMREFLMQNRTQDIVEDRAKQLMNSLVVKYPDRIKIVDKVIENQTYQLMIVRGKLCDWVIINSTYKTHTQKVKTYVFISASYEYNEKTLLPRLGGQFKGPICIDNIHTNSSLGDQYAARALALLNDNVTVKLVNTISKYIPQDILEQNAIFTEIGESRFGVKWEDLDSSLDDWIKVIK
tara:strand:- start:2729 stop:4117 length:1389 start_codon:yes stop_codon:yes gene_type:complete